MSHQQRISSPYRAPTFLLLVFSTWIGFGSETALAVPPPDPPKEEAVALNQLVRALVDVEKGQSDVTMQLTKHREALIKAILDDKPPDEKAKQARVTLKNELTQKEAMLTRQFKDASEILFRLNQRLEKSERPEDRGKVVLLKKARELIVQRDLADNLFRIYSRLKDAAFDDLDHLAAALALGKEVSADLRKVMAVLLEEKREDQLTRALQTAEKCQEGLKQIARDQQTARDLVAGGTAKKDELFQAQVKVTRAIGAFVKEPANTEFGIKKQLLDAVKQQEQAEKAIMDGKNAAAVALLDESLKNLEAARKRLAELVMQLREEKNESRK